MASNRDLWAESFMMEDAPSFPCPFCTAGHLSVKHDTLREEMIAASREYFAGDGYDPDYDYKRFIFLMNCQNRKCQEVVAVAGKTHYVERADDFGGRRFDTYYSPETMIPGPPLMAIPERTPPNAAEAMRQAFTAFWGDRGSAANRLRISVERIMDAEGIPKTAANGSELKLFKRIEKFGETHPSLKDTLDGLRHVGNLGSHDGDVSREALLDAFEVYQEWLRDFYGKYPDRIRTIVAKLNATKGKYT